MVGCNLWALDVDDFVLLQDSLDFQSRLLSHPLDRNVRSEEAIVTMSYRFLGTFSEQAIAVNFLPL